MGGDVPVHHFLSKSTTRENIKYVRPATTTAESKSASVPGSGTAAATLAGEAAKVVPPAAGAPASEGSKMNVPPAACLPAFDGG